MKLPICKVTIHGNEDGMESLQAVALIAIASLVLVQLVNVEKISNRWMNGNYREMEDAATSIGSEEFAQPRSRIELKQEFGRSAEFTKQESFKGVLLHRSNVATHLTASIPNQPLEDNHARNDGHQHFDTPGHRLMGKLGATKARVDQDIRFGKDYSISYGEMVAMGDFFKSEKQLWELATSPGKGKGTREEVEYVRQVIIQRKKHLKSKFSKEAIAAVENRYKWLAANNAAHFTTPQEKFANLPPTQRPDSAGREYLRQHVQAIGLAFAAGKHGQSLNSALRREAFGAHFLTDAVSAGHVRIPRKDIKEWWDSKEPDFNRKFQRLLGEKVAKELMRRGIHKIYPEFVVKYEARKSIKNDMAKMPPLSLGDVVSLGLHDFDNENRLNVIVDGEQTVVEGDGFLASTGDQSENEISMEVNTVALASNAVHSGIEDLKKAHELGKKYPKLSSWQILEKIKNEDGEFNFESFIPSVDQSRARTLPTWKAESVDQLLEDPTMRLIIHSVIKKQIGVLEDFAKGIKKKPNRDAFLGSGGVIDQIKADPLKAFKEIVRYDD